MPGRLTSIRLRQLTLQGRNGGTEVERATAVRAEDAPLTVGILDDMELLQAGPSTLLTGNG